MAEQTIEELAKRASIAHRENRLDEAFRYAKDVVALCRDEDSQQNLVRALMLLGQIEGDSGRPREAIQHYEEAVGISRTVDQPLRFAHTVRHLADLHCEHEAFEAAESCYREALGIYRNDTDTSSGDLANAIRGFAVMKDASGSTDEARILWEEARDLYAALGVEEGVSECNDRLSE